MVCPVKIGDKYDGGVVVHTYQLKGVWRAKLQVTGKDEGLMLMRDVEVFMHKARPKPVAIIPEYESPKRGRKPKAS